MVLRAASLPQKLIAVGGILIVTFAIAASTVLPVHAWVVGLATSLQGLGVGGAVLFAAIYVVGSMALVPASAFSLAAGLIYGASGILLAWLAMMAVAATSFPLARGLLAGRVRRVVQRKRLLRTVAAVIDEEGWRMVLLVRISGIVPFGLQNYSFGITQIPFGPYLLASSVGVLPSIVLSAGVGAIGHAAAETRHNGLRLALLTAAVLAGVAVIAITVRKVRARLAQN
jgi:uncharacterized membrane protein YdjX (TVP38/TMEM64 family)